jgi:hypothetical protein
MDSSDYQFETVGWFSNRHYLDGTCTVTNDFLDKICHIISTGPEYTWCHKRCKQFHQYKYVNKVGDLYPTRLSFDAYYKPIEISFNRFSMVQGPDKIIYVFPHTILYWIRKGFSPSKAFIEAVSTGTVVIHSDLASQAYQSENDELQLMRVWRDYEESLNRAMYREAQPMLPFELPALYKKPKKPIHTFSCPIWVNLGTSQNDGEYIDQSFALPSGVEDAHLKAIIGRQSIHNVALARMAWAYETVIDVSRENKEVADGLRRLFTSPDFFDAFEDVVIANEGEPNMPERVSLLGEKYFPYREDLTE